MNVKLLNDFAELCEFAGLDCEWENDYDIFVIDREPMPQYWEWHIDKYENRRVAVNQLVEFVEDIGWYDDLINYTRLMRKNISIEQIKSIITVCRYTKYNFEVTNTGRIILTYKDGGNIRKEHVSLLELVNRLLGEAA